MIEVKVYSQLTKLNIPVYPIKIKQGSEFPCITYQVVSINKENDINAGIYGSRYRIQVDIWGRSYKEVKELSLNVVEVLNEIGAKSFSLQDLYENETELYREMIEFNLIQGE